MKTVLPPFGDTADGLPVCYWFDDFVSYSGDLLDQLQDEGYSTSSGIALSSLGDFSGKGAGTGNLPLIVYTGAGTKDRNKFGNPLNMTYEDPIAAPTGSTDDHLIAGNYWGLDDRSFDGTADNLNGPVKVGQILDYLHAFDARNNIPVLGLDNNQTGETYGLFTAGEVFIWHPDASLPEGGYKVASWAFDLLNGPVPGNLVAALTGPPNDTFDVPTLPVDPTDPFNNGPWVPAPNDQSFVGASGTTYDVDNNRGSGKVEFYIYAPSMDLSLYNPDDYFAGCFFLSNLNDGFEELYILGNVRPYIIPEPSTICLGLIGIAACGFRALRRRRR